MTTDPSLCGVLDMLLLADPVRHLHQIEVGQLAVQTLHQHIHVGDGRGLRLQVNGRLAADTGNSG